MSLRYPPYGDPRASTGTVYSTSFDPRHSSRNAADYGLRPLNTRDLHTTRKSTNFLDPSSAIARLPHDQPIRRRNTNSEPAGGHRPLTVGAAEIGTYTRPLIRTTDVPRSPVARPYPPREDSGAYVYPASSARRQHYRHNSATTDDINRLRVAEPDRLNRHRNSYVGGMRGYPASPLTRPSPEDDYSYTGPREQFDRDFPAVIPRRHRESFSRGERPTSMMDFIGDYKQPPPPRREPPPPSSVKHFDRLGRDRELRPSSRNAGSDSETDRTSRRHSVKQPIAIHQADRDEGYSSQRDEFGDRRGSRHHKDRYDDDRNTSDRDRERHHRHHHERRNSRTRHERADSKDRSGLTPALAAAGLGAGGIAAAAALKDRDSKDGRSKETDRERELRRIEKEKRHRDRETDLDSEERERKSDKLHDRPAELRTDQAKDRSDSDSGREKRRHRRLHKERPGHEMSSESGSERIAPVAAVAAGVAATTAGAALTENPRTENDSGSHRHHRHRRRHHRDHSRNPDTLAEEDDSLVESPTDVSGPKKVTLVEPQKDEPIGVKPKGILKAPREAFPEDPNPTREGVAPLKDAGKKGIPPGARWTKISRILVNPAALDATQERYEERDGYVIVLRVLSKDEIQKLADKTREIREERELEDRARERHRPSQHGDDDSSSGSDSDVSSDSESSDDNPNDGLDRSHRGPHRSSERRDRPLPIESAQHTGQPNFAMPPATVPQAASQADGTFAAPPAAAQSPVPVPAPPHQMMPSQAAQQSNPVQPPPQAQ